MVAPQVLPDGYGGTGYSSTVVLVCPARKKG